jgi:hypothetical protein
MPTSEVLEQQARHRLQVMLTNKRLAEQADEIAQQAAAMPLPDGLTAQIRELLDKQPELSWDQALAQLIG